MVQSSKSWPGDLATNNCIQYILYVSTNTSITELNYCNINVSIERNIALCYWTMDGEAPSFCPQMQFWFICFYFYFLLVGMCINVCLIMVKRQFMSILEKYTSVDLCHIKNYFIWNDVMVFPWFKSYCHYYITKTQYHQI